ncbi:SinI family autotransporter-associated protein [Yersinia intermedia]|uniref:SinI family autotransporter-associated protein n=1 Tax=Yersinia intermedia TaxID=631 RepID=UPI0022FE6727|nr:SinI family autotransporter-associated protein [Yersinia intermedia]MDA5483424.1 SinI family autotransporter-associated protein [Yersinia intermedia]
MKIQKTFTLKKIVLALAIAGYTMSSAYAVLTLPTGTIRGAAPVLSAPSNGAAQMVDLSSNAAGATLSTGDTVTLTYTYNDSDGDADDSTTSVLWYSVKGGTDTLIASTNVVNTAAALAGQGTSVLTIPGAAAYADAIKVVIQEYSASGDPIRGQTLTVSDTAVAGPNNPSVTPPGPIAPVVGVTAGIYLSTDVGFTNNLAGAGTPLVVNQTYVFKLWDSAAVGTTDLTPAAYSWRLVGTNSIDGTVAPATGFVTSVNGTTFTVPVNTAADGTTLTGSTSGAQGFSLAVDY